MQLQYSRATAGTRTGRLGGEEEALALKARQGTVGNDSFVSGFLRAGSSIAPQPPERPQTPHPHQQQQQQHGFPSSAAQHLHHRFTNACSMHYGAVRATPVQRDAGRTPVDAPCDKQLKQRIDTMAAFVARTGSATEALARSQHAGEFLFMSCFILQHVCACLQLMLEGRTVTLPLGFVLRS